MNNNVHLLRALHKPHIFPTLDVPMLNTIYCLSEQRFQDRLHLLLFIDLKTKMVSNLDTNLIKEGSFSP